MGSNWWCYDLAECMKNAVFGHLLFPEILRMQDNFGLPERGQEKV